MRKYVILLLIILFTLTCAGCSVTTNESKIQEDQEQELSVEDISEEIIEAEEKTNESEESINEIKEDTIQIQTTKEIPKEDKTPEPTPSKVPLVSVKPSEPVEKEEKQMLTETLSQINAVRKAEQYLRTMPFSKTGLIEQLEYEGFSNADATYAVNKLNVNWNDQAVKKGKQYLGTMAFSKSGLIKQLEFEGFSSNEAVYAVNQLNVNWKEQAVKKAKQYLDIMAFSRSGLLEQLEFEGFTTEEATYAADQIGF